MNDDLKEKEASSTGYGGGFRATYNKEEEFSNLSVPESGERTDWNETVSRHCQAGHSVYVDCDPGNPDSTGV